VCVFIILSASDAHTKAVTRKLSDSSIYTQSEFSGDRGGYIVLVEFNIKLYVIQILV
jgi:hypothetical protein